MIFINSATQNKPYKDIGKRVSKRRFLKTHEWVRWGLSDDKNYVQKREVCNKRKLAYKGKGVKWHF